MGLHDETIAVVMVDGMMTVLCRTATGYQIDTIVCAPMIGGHERRSRQITEAEAKAWVAEHGIELMDPDAGGVEVAVS